MEKKTILAVALSILVIVMFYIIQGIFFPPPIPSPAITERIEEQSGSTQLLENAPYTDEEGKNDAETSLFQALPMETAIDVTPVSEERVVIDNGVIIAVFSNAGGDIVSYKLKEHRDKEDFVEMIVSGEKEAHAFSVAFGDIDTVPVSAFFNIRRPSQNIIEFYRDFKTTGVDGENTFRLTKRYEFSPNEYMFDLTIILNGQQNTGFNFAGTAYTLGFGPQIGPKFEKLDQRYEYRNYYTYTNGKRKLEKVNANGTPTIIGNRPMWAGIAGKYFTFIALPYPAQYDIAFSAKKETGVAVASRLFIVRPSLNISQTEDKYRFYLGPKSQETLAIYSNGKNAFNLTNMDLIKVADTSGILAPLETALKWLLMFFYRLIPNYGVAIILLTLLVKLMFFPLTRKGSESTLRMQTLAPKIKEIQDKYKDNAQKMNAEMAEFYKKEGYNPMSGCLPLIIQIPIFFAMYNLFNNHFDLRGAMFIPEWIPDLSLPEAVWNFPDGFHLPILGWTAIRALPFIYVASQLLYGKITQTPGQTNNNTQMKLMLYAMPIVFFFILYDVPSGLLIYWIMSNVLTLFQQLLINKFLAQKKATMGIEQLSIKQPVKLPPKVKKRKK
ncbi:MAG: membrane protein insertase YidC [Treponema sp.]|nr:membrane protein insertase YidC [Treponema sp.]